MRVTAAGDGVTVKAYGGTTGVLVAWDVDDRGDDLLGFAVERRVGSGQRRWLTGALGWEDEEVVPGTKSPSNERPLQKFRWSDYTVQPGQSYTYTVHPVRGTPDSFEVGPGPTVKVKAGVLDKGRHAVLFNRAAAASQAFSKKFPDIEKRIDEALREKREFHPPPEMLTWLSRGMIEQILGFVELATGPEWALDIAIYEYEDPDIVRAVKAAHARGAAVRVVYHTKTGDEQAEVNEAALKGLPKRAKRARKTSRIFHHKFAVGRPLLQARQPPPTRPPLVRRNRLNAAPAGHRGVTAGRRRSQLARPATRMTTPPSSSMRHPSAGLPSASLSCT